MRHLCHVKYGPCFGESSYDVTLNNNVYYYIMIVKGYFYISSFLLNQRLFPAFKRTNLNNREVIWPCCDAVDIAFRERITRSLILLIKY